jgi:hypothetical protein
MIRNHNHAKANVEKSKFPFAMTLKALIFYIITIILAGLFFFFVRRDLESKIVACIVCPLMIVYLIYAYRKEKKADKMALLKNSQIVGREYFESPEWHEKYLEYLVEHSFERPKYPDMKLDLLKRFRRKEYVIGMLCMLIMMLGSCCLFPMEQYAFAIAGICLFGFLFYLEFSLFIGMPVRKWLKRDIDYEELEKSYLRSEMLTFKKNGLAFGTTHIHGFTEKTIYAIDYRLVEGISRKVVRLKKYEDGIYSSEEYEHFAVIHVRLPQSGNIHHVEIELNEFQVQMAIDKLYEYENPTVSEKKYNSFV